MLRMRDTSTFQLAPGELGRGVSLIWHFVMERCIIDLPCLKQVEQNLFIIIVSVYLGISGVMMVIVLEGRVASIVEADSY